jgi:hypothetical protein
VDPQTLATTTGVISTTGIARLALGGSLGWLMGKYGLACHIVALCGGRMFSPA